MIKLKSRGHQQGIDQNRENHRHKGRAAIWILRIIKPACSYDIPNDKSKVRTAKNCPAFSFYIRLRNVFLHE